MNLQHAALIIIDMQNDFVGPQAVIPCKCPDAMIENLNALRAFCHGSMRTTSHLPVRCGSFLRRMRKAKVLASALYETPACWMTSIFFSSVNRLPTVSAHVRWGRSGINFPCPAAVVMRLWRRRA